MPKIMDGKAEGEVDLAQPNALDGLVESGVLNALNRLVESGVLNGDIVTLYLKVRILLKVDNKWVPQSRYTGTIQVNLSDVNAKQKVVASARRVAESYLRPGFCECGKLNTRVEIEVIQVDD